MSGKNTDTGGLSRRQSKRRAQNTRRKNQNKQTTKSVKKKFVGMDNGALSGIAITKSTTTPLPQQYDALYNALLTYAGSRPKGGGKLKSLSRI